MMAREDGSPPLWSPSDGGPTSAYQNGQGNIKGDAAAAPLPPFGASAKGGDSDAPTKTDVLNPPTYHESAQATDAMDILRIGKLNLVSNDKPLGRSSFKIVNRETGAHVGNVSSSFEASSSTSGAHMAYTVSDIVGNPVMVIRRPYFGPVSKISVYLGQDGTTELGTARVSLSSVKVTSDLEVDGRSYAMLKSTIFRGKYEALRNADKQRLASVQRHLGGFFTRRYEFTFGEIASQQDMMARTLIVATIISVEYAKLEGGYDGPSPYSGQQVPLNVIF